MDLELAVTNVREAIDRFIRILLENGYANVGESVPGLLEFQDQKTGNFVVIPAKFPYDLESLEQIGAAVSRQIFSELDKKFANNNLIDEVIKEVLKRK